MLDCLWSINNDVIVFYCDRARCLTGEYRGLARNKHWLHERCFYVSLS